MYGPDLPPSRYHHQADPPPLPNGSKALSLLLRLCAMLLAVVSAVVMAASSECAAHAPSDDSGAAASVVTFTYNRFGAFVLLVGCNITAAILEALAVYLHVSLDVAAVTAAAAADEKDSLDEEEAPAGVNIPAIVLVVVDLLVHALLYSATAAAYTAAAAYAAQIGACARFAGQVERAKILSLAASIAVTLAAVAKDVPLPFNVPPVLG
ncbi:CASP-like protein 1U2 [Aegilops tauschii subsp. strangulata]|uniref:CASP-like protein 1U2 n=1 Tax=Aegilops tauschii subsp. strangulata TaxID=200361 RepID=UPI00098AD643|nr:CASP-like protein 1U2 [Aegilops tauschii subsp. strangulata]